MKIIATEEEVLKVYDDGDDIWLEFEDKAYALSPIEAKDLCDLLYKVYKESTYFKGFGARA